MYTLLLLSSLLSSIAPASATSAPAPDPPEELGAVTWSRDLDAALADAEASGKPALILFQEVPGCGNCTRYGREILSAPLIVEAIEDLFEPVAIYNNAGGADAAALKRYGEPAWNNPVVRIVDADGENLVERMPNFTSVAQLTGGMASALRRSGREVPHYLRLLHEDARAREADTAQVTYATACFWSGEAFFGAQPGVIATEAGWQEGREVVRVTYAESQTSADALSAAAATETYHAVPEGAFALDREPKYYLLHSKYAGLGLEGLQAVHVNACLGRGEPVEELLSPRQRAAVL